jgi:hypothetical protein
MASNRLSVPATLKILQDPNIFIADTAATAHSTPWWNGLTNCRRPKPDDTIIFGGGDAHAPSAIGDITAIHCDQFGDQRLTVQLKDVVCNPKSVFNLFSVTKLLKDGWSLKGDASTGLILRKGSAQIVFDILIPTSKGVLYCAYFSRGAEVAAAGPDGKPLLLLPCLLPRPTVNWDTAVKKAPVLLLLPLVGN